MFIFTRFDSPKPRSCVKPDDLASDGSRCGKRASEGSNKKPTLKKNHTVSFPGTVKTAQVEKHLDNLASVDPDIAERLDRVKAVVTKLNLRMVASKDNATMKEYEQVQRQMTPDDRKVINETLQDTEAKGGKRIDALNYRLGKHKGAYGYAFNDTSYIVVDGDWGSDVTRMGAKRYINRTRRMLENDEVKTMSKIARLNPIPGFDANVITYLHEMGHKINFKAEAESVINTYSPKKTGITAYGRGELAGMDRFYAVDHAQKENFAESFVAWVVAPDILKDRSPKMYDLVELSMKMLEEKR